MTRNIGIVDSYSEQLRRLGTTWANGSRICWHDSVLLSVVDVFIEDSAVKYEHSVVKYEHGCSRRHYFENCDELDRQHKTC